MSKHLAAQLAGVVQDRHRHAITAVVEEISVAEMMKDSVADQLMPVTMHPFAILEHEILSGYGGKTQERALGEKGKSVPGRSSKSKVFKPGSYQEHVPFDENKLLKLRKLGTIGDRGISGLTNGELNFLEMEARKLKGRLVTRVRQLQWDAIFTGKYVFMGIEFDFAIPATNIIAAATDWSVADTGNPFEDLMLLFGQNAKLRRVRPLISKLIINPKTAADIVMRALEQGYITNNNIRNVNVNEVMKFACPGLPEFEVVADCAQDETIDAEGQVSLADAAFLVPDDKILVVLKFEGANVHFPKYGEMQLTENLNDPSATLDKPAVGTYTFVDEKGLEERESPHVKIVAGFNGGPNLMRPFDTFIITV